MKSSQKAALCFLNAGAAIGAFLAGNNATDKNGLWAILGVAIAAAVISGALMMIFLFVDE